MDRAREYARGAEIPEPANAGDCSGTFNLRIPRSLHQRLAWAADSDGVSLNQYVLMHLAPRDADAGISHRAAAARRDAGERVENAPGARRRPRR